MITRRGLIKGAVVFSLWRLLRSLFGERDADSGTIDEAWEGYAEAVDEPPLTAAEKAGILERGSGIEIEVVFADNPPSPFVPGDRGTINFEGIEIPVFITDTWYNSHYPGSGFKARAFTSHEIAIKAMAAGPVQVDRQESAYVYSVHHNCPRRVNV